MPRICQVCGQRHVEYLPGHCKACHTEIARMEATGASLRHERMAKAVIRLRRYFVAVYGHQRLPELGPPPPRANTRKRKAT